MSADFFKWSDDYALGIETIDEQHKKLVAIINRIYKSFVDRDEERVIAESLKEMADYTDYHFKTEERLFRQYGFEDTTDHVAKHKIFVDKINQFQIDQEKGHKITYSVMNFLRSWILEHIQKTDKEYVALFKSKGVV